MTTPAGRTTIRPDGDLAALVRGWLLEAAERIIASAQHLTDLDARIGDGDHGINLRRGMSAVTARLQSEPLTTAADDLRLSGRVLVSTVGGASGPLYGTLFLEMGDGLDDRRSGHAALAPALERGVAGVGRRGRSSVGQKTMLDTLVPASRALTGRIEAGDRFADAAEAAAAAAREGCESTRQMIAQRGRASYLGERALGHVDPGATSSLLLIEALPLVTRRLEARPA